MRIVRYYEAGGPEVLKIEETAIPQPEAGQVLVKVEALDLGFVDTQMRGKASPWGAIPLPATPGGYVYGTVAQVGPGVSNVHAGDPILGFAPVGAYADYAIVPLALRITPLPAGLSPEEQVALPVAGETAYHILATSAQIRPGERVLIHAAAGGIGHVAVQLARAMQAGQIIATASSTAKLEVARSLGADTLINYSESNWAEQVRQATGGKGVDIVLDMVGGQILIESIPLLALFGRLIFYGAASGKIPTLPAESVMSLMMNLNRLEGFASFTVMQARPELMVQGREALRQYVEQGQVRPRIMRTFSLDEVAEAHRLLESRASYGKIVIRP
jgi:NADPH2:quinone reductase